MKVRLADVGDPLAIDPFTIGKHRGRYRKTGETGGGGGTDDGGDDSADDDSDDSEDDSEDESKEEDEEEKPEGGDDLQKAIRRRDRALARARKAEAALAEATKKKEDEAEDPTAKANARLVRAEAKSQLAAIGITDKEDQRAILDVLRLDDIDVDDEGDVDDEAVEDRITELRRIFGSGSAPARRVPKSTSAKDKGGNNKDTSDPDAARYKRIMGARR